MHLRDSRRPYQMTKGKMHPTLKKRICVKYHHRFRGHFFTDRKRLGLLFHIVHAFTWRSEQIQLPTFSVRLFYKSLPGIFFIFQNSMWSSKIVSLSHSGRLLWLGFGKLDQNWYFYDGSVLVSLCHEWYLRYSVSGNNDYIYKNWLKENPRKMVQQNWMTHIIWLMSRICLSWRNYLDW